MKTILLAAISVLFLFPVYGQNNKVAVTFRVNLNGILGFSQPNVSGNFNNWCGNCQPLINAKKDGIWSTTIQLSPGTHEYKYTFDNWAGSEKLTAVGACFISGNGYTNRVVTVTKDTVLEAFCWQSCLPAENKSETGNVLQIETTSGKMSFCEGAVVEFKARLSNEESHPWFQWKVDGLPVGGNEPILRTNTLKEGQTITCEATCGCHQKAPLASNQIVIHVTPSVIPSVSIKQDKTHGEGKTIQFTATVENGGTNPSFQWLVNEKPFGTNSPTLVLKQGLVNASVKCRMTSNANCTTAPFKQIWSDEFSGSRFDTTKWVPEIGDHGWGNQELQNYTGSARNAELKSGFLNIIARKEPSGKLEYSSARLISKNKFSCQYGKIEGRMALPYGAGLWPAFWMLGTNIDEVHWPLCGEIDIMEHINSDNHVLGTMHWKDGDHVYKGGMQKVDSREFHNYSVEWDSLSVRFFVDNQFYHQHWICDGNNSKEEFTHPFFLLLNLAVGGQLPGPVAPETVFPATMKVDYVRVYSRESGKGIESNEIRLKRK